MPFFTDNARRSWCVRVVYDDVVRVRDALGVDLLSPHKVGGDGMTLIKRLTQDDSLLANVLFVLCESQADGVNDAAFGRLLKGDDVLMRARLATFEAWAEFFPTLDEDEEDEEESRGAKKPVDVDSLLWELAGVVGVHPGAFTFRQLYRMNRGKCREAWQHTTSMMALTKSIATRKPVRPSDLDPFKPKRKKGTGLPFRVIVEAMVASTREKQQQHRVLP